MYQWCKIAAVFVTWDGVSVPGQCLLTADMLSCVIVLSELVQLENTEAAVAWEYWVGSYTHTHV